MKQTVNNTINEIMDDIAIDFIIKDRISINEMNRSELIAVIYELTKQIKNLPTTAEAEEASRKTLGSVDPSYCLGWYKASVEIAKNKANKIV